MSDRHHEGPVPETYFGRVNARVRTLDPIATVDDATEHVVTKLHDGLTFYPAGSHEPELLLADDCERAADLRTYTFTLKEGITFHDGRELTAGDVVYSFERLAASPHSERASLLLDALGVEHETDADGEYVPRSLAVDALDSYRVELALAEPFHATRHVLASPALSIVPEGIVGDVAGYDGERSRSTFASEEPIGCGPFAFEEWRTDPDDGTGRLLVERFDDYHGDRPSVAGICWYTGYDADERRRLLLEGDVDLAGIPSDHYDPDLAAVHRTDERGRKRGTYGPVATGETLGLVRVPILSTYFLAFDTASVPAPVRRAAAYAVDQHEPAMRFKGRHEPAYHVLPPALFPAEDPAEYARENYPYGYDEVRTERAREVMAAAGYGPDDRVEVTISAPVMLDWTPLYERLRDRLAAAYVDVDLEELPFADLLDRRRSGDVDVYYGGWVADWPAIDSGLRPLAPDGVDSAYADHLNWAGTEAAQRARSAWKRVRRNQAPTPEAAAARERAARDVELANWEDVAILPLCHSVKQFLWNDRVEPDLPGRMSYRLLKNTGVRLTDQRG